MGFRGSVTKGQLVGIDAGKGSQRTGAIQTGDGGHGLAL